LTEALSPTLDTRNRYIPPLAPTNAGGDWTSLSFVEEAVGRRQGGAGVEALPELPALYSSPTRSVKSPARSG